MTLLCVFPLSLRHTHIKGTYLVAIYLRRLCSSVAACCPGSAAILTLFILLVSFLIATVVLTV